MLEKTIDELHTLRRAALRLERRFAPELGEVHPTFRVSARNLVHYLALRDHDIRALQERLAALGLSSLGRTESHVMAALEAVLRILHHLAGRIWSPEADSSAGTIAFATGDALLAEHTERVLGPRPPQRAAHIMVTMPGEAARDRDVVRQALASGMDCMRVNCAHDDPVAWERMVDNLRRAKNALHRDCRVLMDLGGPKLRTGAIDPGSQMLRLKPARDQRGAVTTPLRVWITAAESPQPPPAPAGCRLEVPSTWLHHTQRGEQVRFTDLRGRTRTLALEATATGGRWASFLQSAYLAEGQALPLHRVGKRGADGDGRDCYATPHAPTSERHFIPLAPGDVLLLTSAPKPGRPAVQDRRGRRVHPAQISCTLPEVFADVRASERILFDDGKIGGVIEAVLSDALRVRITTTPVGGGKLRADKGINLPDSRLLLPALTGKDLADLDFVVRHADLVGLSFVRTPEDVHELRRQLELRDARAIGIVLKIETTTAFEHLPILLLAAMRSEKVAVMIARGDLAVECGYERLAEVQEEVLWFCEAAHVPVIWATQVLESLAKSGVPSRAEITDAAMGARAECVMLNKGPHLVEAVQVLQNILQRMETHQRKKSARLRRLRLSKIAARA